MKEKVGYVKNGKLLLVLVYFAALIVPLIRKETKGVGRSIGGKG
jgi:hypothetical protein